MAPDNLQHDHSGGAVAGENPRARRRYSFRLVLPVGQLLLSGVLMLIVCGPRSLIPVRARVGYVAVKVTFTDTTATPQHPQSDRWMRIKGQVFSSVWLLNLPGGMLQMKAAAYGINHHGWIAAAMDAISSSSLSSSVLALPFWWIAGRGADALAARRRKLIPLRIRFSEAAVSFVLLMGGALVASVEIVAFVSGNGAAMVLAGMLLWSFLGGIGVRARYLERREEKKQLAISS